MLNSGKKISRFCATKKINILTLVLSEKKFLNETKNHTPPPPPNSIFSLFLLVLSSKHASIEQLIGKWSEIGVKLFTIKLLLPCKGLDDTSV